MSCPAFSPRPANIVWQFQSHAALQSYNIQRDLNYPHILQVRLGGPGAERRLRTTNPKRRDSHKIFTQYPNIFPPFVIRRMFSSFQCFVTVTAQNHEMSYYRYITGIYKSYWPELNRSLRSSSSPRHIPEPVPRTDQVMGRRILTELIFRSYCPGNLTASRAVLLKLLLQWPRDGQAFQREIPLHATAALLLLRGQVCGHPATGDLLPLHGLRLQGHQLHGKTCLGGHRQDVCLQG